jgi:hypothetical protein
MTAKEKADYLLHKMSIDFDMCRGQNIQCAINAVDEIIKSNPVVFENVLSFTEDKITQAEWVMINNTKYWQEVMKELEKL